MGLVVDSYRFAAAGGFSPDDISGLVGWWDASDTSTITSSSGDVSQWDDKSGNARHFAQATSARRPKTGAHTINSLNVISFTSASQHYMDTGSFTLAQPLTAIFVVERSTFVTFSGVLSGVGGNLQIGYTASGGSNTAKYYAGSNEVVSYDPGTAAAVLESYIINGASSASFKDGAAAGTGNPGSSGSTTGLRLAERNLFAYSNNRYAEVVVYDTALGTTDREAVEDYLADKWGL
jgi:hypothetical protein